MKRERTSPELRLLARLHEIDGRLVELSARSPAVEEAWRPEREAVDRVRAAVEGFAIGRELASDDLDALRWSADLIRRATETEAFAPPGEGQAREGGTLVAEYFDLPEA